MTPEQAKGESGTCETIKVKHEGGYAVINASDFDAKTQEKYEEPGQAKDGGKGKTSDFDAKTQEKYEEPGQAKDGGKGKK